MIHQKINKLLVQKLIKSKDSKGRYRSYYECLCDCGKTVVIRSDGLKSGHAKSCGCYKLEIWKNNVTTHGLSTINKTVYLCWASMMQRCNKPECHNYSSYGGRGIKVCERWANKTDGLRNFLNDMLPSWKKGLTIDRIDNNKDYSPGNCRWATCEEQQNNKRNNRFITAKGETMSVARWARAVKISESCIRHRIRKGVSDSELIAPSCKA